jgi:hypothetical protein
MSFCTQCYGYVTASNHKKGIQLCSWCIKGVKRMYKCSSCNMLFGDRMHLAKYQRIMLAPLSEWVPLSEVCRICVYSQIAIDKIKKIFETRQIWGFRITYILSSSVYEMNIYHQSPDGRIVLSHFKEGHIYPQDLQYDDDQVDEDIGHPYIQNILKLYMDKYDDEEWSGDKENIPILYKNKLYKLDIMNMIINEEPCLTLQVSRSSNLRFDLYRNRVYRTPVITKGSNCLNNLPDDALDIITQYISIVGSKCEVKDCTYAVIRPCKICKKSLCGVHFGGPIMCCKCAFEIVTEEHMRLQNLSVGQTLMELMINELTPDTKSDPLDVDREDIEVPDIIIDAGDTEEMQAQIVGRVYTTIIQRLCRTNDRKMLTIQLIRCLSMVHLD